MINFNFNMPINEMAKNTSYRTLDDKAWLSVASQCSKNKATNAENVKPMSKFTKDDLVNRYSAALVIMKKPCPMTEDDIETIGSFKLYAYKALEMGATFAEIQNAYNINKGLTTNPAPIANQADTIDPDDHILNDIIDNDGIDDENAEITSDIDPDDSILDNIIKDGKKDLSDDEWDNEAVKNLINKFNITNGGTDNEISCPVSRADYANDTEFIRAFNEYLNSINGVERKEANGRIRVGMVSKKYFEFGSLVSVDAISANGDIMYITSDPIYDYSDNADMPHVIKPMPNNIFMKYNKWEISANNKFEPNISMTYVATKLIKIFNENGFHIKAAYVNYDPEDYD